MQTSMEIKLRRFSHCWQINRQREMRIRMRRFLDLLDKIVIAILIILLSIMLAVGTMQVVWRYVLQQSLSWSEETLRYLYVWATMLGVGAAIRRKSFACIDSFLDFAGKKSPCAKAIMQIIAAVVQIFVFSLLIFYGYQFMARGSMQNSPALPVKMSYIYAAFPVGGVLGLIYTLEEINTAITGNLKCVKEGPEKA